MVGITIILCGEKNPFQKAVSQSEEPRVKGELAASELTVHERISGRVIDRVKVVTDAGWDGPASEPALGAGVCAGDFDGGTDCAG